MRPWTLALLLPACGGSKDDAADTGPTGGDTGADSTAGDDTTPDPPGGDDTSTRDTASLSDQGELPPTGDVTATEVLWTWSRFSRDSSLTEVRRPPSVGVLQDTKADGEVDRRVRPSVVFVAACDLSRDASQPNGCPGTQQRSALVVLDGADGTEVWGWTPAEGLDPWSYTAVVDATADGRKEILVMSGEGRMLAVRPRGQLLWRSIRLTGSLVVDRPLSSRFSVADLDGDGDVEIVVNDRILDGATGEVVAALDFRRGAVGDGAEPVRISAVADLDRDGDQEIAYAGELFDHTGRRLASVWNGDWVDGSFVSNVIVQADDDPDGEVAFVKPTGLRIAQPDGALGREIDFGPGIQLAPSTPCAADFDGDGRTELAVVDEARVVRLLELDGSQIWANGVGLDETWRHAPSCSVFDLNVDGTPDVLLAWRNNLSAFSGVDGERWSLLLDGPVEHHALHGYPVLADVNQDAAVDLLITGMDRGRLSNVPRAEVGIVVVSNTDRYWRRAGWTWPVPDYAVGNITPDGTVPTTPDPIWGPGTFVQGRPTNWDPDPDTAE